MAILFIMTIILLLIIIIIVFIVGFILLGRFADSRRQYVRHDRQTRPPNGAE